MLHKRCYIKLPQRRLLLNLRMCVVAINFTLFSNQASEIGGANMYNHIHQTLHRSKFFTNLVIHIILSLFHQSFFYDCRATLCASWSRTCFIEIYFSYYYWRDINFDTESFIIAHTFTMRKAYFEMIAWKEVTINLRWCRMHAYRQLRHLITYLSTTNYNAHREYSTNSVFSDIRW